MTHAKLIIKRFSDKTDLLENPTNPTEGKLETIFILEKGMESGKTSITIHIKLADGTDVLAQTSAQIMRAMVSAIDGAEQNWKENPE